MFSRIAVNNLSHGGVYREMLGRWNTRRTIQVDQVD